MSPAATRRYIVRFTDWAVYETVVLATSKREALAKAIALYDANGYREFTRDTTGTDGWHAQRLGTEVRS
jgi:hypothetical protein